MSTENSTNTPSAPPAAGPSARAGMPVPPTKDVQAAKDAKAPKPVNQIENSTDATQGEPLAIRARARKAELETFLLTIEPHDTAVKADVERALSSVTTLLGGDSAHLSAVTAAELDRWLEGAKHLGEMAAPAKRAPKSAR